MASIYDWSTTAADNDDADSIVDWSEGQLPATVNGSARAMMKRVAERMLDQGPVSAGGTANALTITTNAVFVALADGLQITLKATATNTGAATLNANSLGAKHLRKIIRGGSDVALSAGDIQQGGIYDLRYDAAANSAAGAWIVMTPALSAVALGDNTFTSTVNIDNATFPTLQLNDSSSNVLSQISAGISSNQLTIRHFTSPGSGVTASEVFFTAAGSVNVSTGTLQQGGVAVATVSDTQTLTNKTISGGTVNPATLGVTGNATIGGTLNVTGAAAALSSLAVTGNFAVNTNKFVVTASTGNTTVAGTLGVTGVISENSVEVAKVSASSDAGEISFPIGTVLLVTAASTNPNRNAAVSVFKSSGNIQFQDTSSGPGSQLDGTWRANGSAGTTGAAFLARRVA